MLFCKSHLLAQKRAIKKNRAFTLTEVLVVMTILSIVLMIVAPTVMGLYARVTVDANAESLMEGLRMARLHADNRQSRVALCAGPPEASCGETDWGEGWTIFYSDLEAGGSSLEPLMSQEAAGLPLIILAGDIFSQGRIIFDGRGVLFSPGVTQGDITFCHSTSYELVRLDLFPTGQEQTADHLLPIECRG